MRRLLLPVVALALAGVSTFAVRSYLDRGPPQIAVQIEEAQPVLARAVLVAATNLPSGSFIQADHLRWQEWPDVALPETYLERGKAHETDLVGAVVRRTVAAGEPIALGNVVKPGDRGFLAAVLDPGMRAVSVPVDEASSNAGLIFPGDRVDLIVTHQLEIAGDDSTTRRVSETVLEDVRVIAMGGRLNAEAGSELGAAPQARTATLETTPAGAEKVALVAELGKLSLSLRSLAVAGDAPVRGAEPAPLTWDLDASPALRPENQPRSTLNVVRGGKIETITVRHGAGT